MVNTLIFIMIITEFSLCLFLTYVCIYVCTSIHACDSMVICTNFLTTFFWLCLWLRCTFFQSVQELEPRNFYKDFQAEAQSAKFFGNNFQLEDDHVNIQAGHGRRSQSLEKLLTE